MEYKFGLEIPLKTGQKYYLDLINILRAQAYIKMLNSDEFSLIYAGDDSETLNGIKHKWFESYGMANETMDDELTTTNILPKNIEENELVLIIDDHRYDIRTLVLKANTVLDDNKDFEIAEDVVLRKYNGSLEIEYNPIL